MILFDTDVCIEILRGNKSVIKKRMDTEESVAISFMTVGELYYGADKSAHPEKNRLLVDDFISSVEVVDSDLEIMKKFGELKSLLIKAGTQIADADVLIAATSLTRCSFLVTGNVQHFSRIRGLVIENWVR